MNHNIIYIIVIIYIKLISWIQKVCICVRKKIHGLRSGFVYKRDILDRFRSFWSSYKLSVDKNSSEMYEFRPYELNTVDYKSYRGLFGEGIHKIPKARSGHRIVCTDTDIYSFGGFNPDVLTYNSHHGDHLMPEMWKFNILTKKWSLINDGREPTMPKVVVSNAMAIKNNVIFIYGGTGFPFGLLCSNRCYAVLPHKSPIRYEVIKTTGREPPGLYGQSIVIIDKYLYTVGGTTGYEYSCDVHRFDLVDKAWICLYKHQDDDIDGVPSGRYRHEVVTDGKYLFVMGGGTLNQVNSLNSIYAFNLSTNKWVLIKTIPDPLVGPRGYPSARKCHTAVQIETPNGVEVAITGGYDNESDLRDIWMINLEKLQWRKLAATLPKPLYFHSATVTNSGLMYVFGGIEGSNANNQTEKRTNSLYSIWITIPKLADIAWDAVLHYAPTIPKYKMEQLMEMGIPRQYAERVKQNQLQYDCFK